MPLTWLSLVPWRLVGIVAVLVGVFSYGYYGGMKYELEKQQVIAAKQLAAVLADERARAKLSADLDASHIAATEKVRTVTRTIVKVIHDENPDASCNLSNRWVYLHDQAAAGTVPEPASLDHAKPSGVGADSALEQVAENYGTFHEVRQLALDCQNWIKQQQTVGEPK